MHQHPVVMEVQVSTALVSLGIKAVATAVLEQLLALVVTRCRLQAA
jgi:hypothetical protein